MKKKIAGILFCIAAVLLFLPKYVGFVLFACGISSWKDRFLAGFAYVGVPLLLLSVLSVIVGVGCLIWAGAAEGNGKRKNQ